MTAHLFDAGIAVQVGVNAAVIYQNIVFWVEKNQANRKHLHEGRYWTYNSISAFAEQFPYLSERQIRTAIDKLKDAGLVVVGNFNKSNYDRTTWYSCQIDLTLMSNGKDQNVEPIPDSKPDIKTDTGIQQAEHEPVEIQLDIEDQIDRVEKQEYPHKLTLDQLKQISLHWENSMSGISPLVDLTKKTQVNKKRWAKINKVLKDHPEYWDDEYFSGYFDRLATMQEFEWQRSNNQLSFDQALQLDKFERNRDVMLLAENKR